jgi:hypothetical protein
VSETRDTAWFWTIVGPERQRQTDGDEIKVLLGLVEQADLIAHQAARLEEVTRERDDELIGERWHADEAARQRDVAKAALTAAEAEKERLQGSLLCAQQQCATAVYHISQREHDEAVVRSFQSIADFCARAALSPKKEPGDAVEA